MRKPYTGIRHMDEQRDLRTMPKVELHRHLDGSVRVQTILDLARRQGLDVGDPSRLTITTPMDDLEAVLACFATLQAVLSSAEAISRVTFENVEDAWADGVRLVELRFAPAFIAGKARISHDEIIEAVLDGTARGMARYPVEVGLIGILPRSAPLEANARATRDLVRWRASGAPGADRLCGFDLADAEAGVDPRQFVPLVEQAREAGLGITIHSGEDSDAASRCPDPRPVQAAQDRPRHQGLGGRGADGAPARRGRAAGGLPHLELAHPRGPVARGAPAAAPVRAGVPVCSTRTTRGSWPSTSCTSTRCAGGSSASPSRFRGHEPRRAGALVPARADEGRGPAGIPFAG